MASKNFVDMQGLTQESLQSELNQAVSELKRMKFDHLAKGSENPSDIRALKKNIARFKTELRSREMQAMSPAELANRSRIRLRRK